MRKGRDGEKKKREEKRLMEIVATPSLPAVDRLNADCWNAALSRQNKENRENKEIIKNGEYRNDKHNK